PDAVLVGHDRALRRPGDYSVGAPRRRARGMRAEGALQRSDSRLPGRQGLSVNEATRSTDGNVDLLVGEGGRPTWNQPDHRRRAFHNMHTVFRYSLGIRAPRVLRLRKGVDRRIGDLPSVRRLTGTAYFSRMVAVRGADVLFEQHAPNFAPDQPHSIQSITKTTMNLAVGR